MRPSRAEPPVHEIPLPEATQTFYITHYPVGVCEGFRALYEAAAADSDALSQPAVSEGTPVVKRAPNDTLTVLVRGVTRFLDRVPVDMAGGVCFGKEA